MVVNCVLILLFTSCEIYSPAIRFLRFKSNSTLSSFFIAASMDMVDNSGKSVDDVLLDIFGDENEFIEHEETGTPEEQSSFMNELDSFYREKGTNFTPPRLYGEELNCLKLYRAVIRLGGYDQVTRGSLWQQIGISYKYLPEACNLPSELRIFYEKVLLEYERHQDPNSKLELAVPSVPDPPAAANVTTGSGRPRRDAATSAMQGWNAPHRYGYDEIAEPVIKNKSLNKMEKCKQKFKSTGLVKNKQSEELEHHVKAAPTETSQKRVTTVVDVGPRCDSVKINVLENAHCFEVYALVPGFSLEEIKLKVDPKGRLVIMGQPKDHDNPWGITAFQKVVIFPVRIDPPQMSALVTQHGQLFVRILTE